MKQIFPKVKHNLAFVGARGAGKTKIARKLSKRIGWPLLSVDQLISYECEGKSIEELVSEIGWRGFRDIEFAILRKAVNMEGVIIDCGGGCLVEAPVAGPSEDEAPVETFSERKYALLRDRSTLIYIQRSWDWMMKKSGLDPNRPDLGGDYKTLLERRLPWYERAADHVLDMQDRSNIPAAVEEVLKLIS